EINDDDDEVLLAMACEPAAFIGLVAEIVFAYVLLPPLESLCIIVETVVQDKVVASLCKIGVQMKERDVVEWFIPFVTRLGAGEWFTVRVSACGIFHIVYSSAPDLLRAELRLIFNQLVGPLVEAMYLEFDIMTFRDLTQYDHDSVRHLVVENCAASGKLLEPIDCVGNVFPVIVSFLQDELLDERLNRIGKLDEVIGIDLLSESLLPDIVELAEDRRWCVLLAIIEDVSLLASPLGAGEKLGAICMQWLEDQVETLTFNQPPNLGLLAEEFDPEWTLKHIVPQTMLPVVINASKDKVPNIELNVAKILQSMIPVMDYPVGSSPSPLYFLGWFA
uniref:Uncharacterized protein n=2 Tax=Physcomitrium patens TaxID=3218 RepID=A0A7I4DQQ4_PHYPA